MYPFFSCTLVLSSVFNWLAKLFRGPHNFPFVGHREPFHFSNCKRLSFTHFQTYLFFFPPLFEKIILGASFVHSDSSLCVFAVVNNSKSDQCYIEYRTRLVNFLTWSKNISKCHEKLLSRRRSLCIHKRHAPCCQQFPI